jgi:hypothetical protein
MVFLAAALLVVPAAGYAAVQGSLHDVDAYTGTEGKIGGACAYCHIPHGAAGDKLYKDTITATTDRWMTTEQPISRICSTCHNASGGNFIDSTRVTVAMYNDNAHNDVVANMTGWGDNASLSGVRLSTDSLKLECTSCHDPHETSRRPFLKYTSAAGDIHGNCVTCHINRNNETTGGTGNSIPWNDGTNSGDASQHPTEKNMSGDNPGDQAEEWQTTINSAFTTAPVTNTSQDVVTAGSGYWSSKGKYSPGSAVGCQTCHAVHGVESGAGGATGTVSFHNQTQKGTGVVVLAMDRTPTSSSPFCQGCHLETDLVTPAGAEHPVNTLEDNWNVDVQVASTTWAQYWTWPIQSTQYTIVCETCHDVHYGTDNTAILRKQAGNLAANGGIDNQLATNYANVGAFCNECHSSSPGVGPTFVTGRHHPVSYLKDGSTVLALDFEGGAAGGQNINVDTTPSTLRHATAANVEWDTRQRSVSTEAAYTWGSIGADTVMVCGTCHGNTGAGAAGAHTLAYDLDTNTESEMCVDCHTFNPSTFTLDYEKTAGTLNDNSIMTHFVGTIGTSGYKRTSAFTGGPAAPKYAADSTGDGDIICESCHYWKDGNQMATNIGALGHDSDAVQDNVYGLLAISGNATDSTDNTAYLCGGCHGNAPGTGSSHPTQPGTAGLSDDVASTDVQDSITGTQGSLAKGWATLNDANKVNCESCHRPHNATFGTGALILEANDNTLPASDKPAFQLMADNTAGSQLNQEGLCERCHLQGQ